MSRDEKLLLCLMIIILILICGLAVQTIKVEELEEQEAQWTANKEALEQEQEKLQINIEEVREQLLKAEEQLKAHNLLIWDIRSRLHLDLELQLEELDY